MKSMVRDWFREVKLYTFGNGFSSETGHYTQLVWANTAKLGCGYSYYKQIDEDGVTAWYAGYLVCNYSPAGNYIGEDPYIKGRVNCEGHGLVNSEKYPHLCVKKQEN
uniref:Antigen-5-like protein n=1 Tax=Triatoma infestans TaxID=30076 RepID=A0A171B052_TRIIF